MNDDKLAILKQVLKLTRSGLLKWHTPGSDIGMHPILITHFGGYVVHAVNRQVSNAFLLELTAPEQKAVSFRVQCSRSHELLYELRDILWPPAPAPAPAPDATIQGAREALNALEQST